MKLHYIFVFSALLLLSACGPSRFVVPLEKGEQAVSLSLGGPVVNVPGVATLPLPMTSVTYGKGVKKGLTLYGSWFTTAAIFGTLQFDAGATKNLWEAKQKKHGVATSVGFNFATDVFEWNSVLWPQLDVNYYWRYNHRGQIQDDLLTGGVPKSNYLYAGIGSWFELKRKRAHGEPQETIVLPILNLGHDFNWDKWSLKTELKLIAPFTSNENIVLDYRSLTGDFGATGFYFGVTRRF